MSDCRWVASDQPRVLPGRHSEDCADRHGDDEHGCRGCLPCTEAHCRVCGRAHADGTCAECMADVRANLHEIARRCDALPDEVEHRGVNGEAMMLLGPAADPEARGHLEASVAAGRVPADYLEHANHEQHPMYVLLTWQMVWRDALDHDEAGDAELATAVDYLDRTLTYMAGFEHVPFEDFGRDLRQCLTHIEAVLHDQSNGDRANVGCFECGGDLERRLTKADGFEDWWTCQRCRRRYTQAEYNFALRASLEAKLAETA